MLRHVRYVIALVVTLLLSFAVVPPTAATAGAARSGYWLVRADGATFPFGGADSRVGPASVIRGLRTPIVAVASTPTGRGMWMTNASGGVFAFGDARFHGSAAGLKLASPITGITPSSDGGGYWLVSRGGGVFAFGNAAFHGSATGQPTSNPMIGIAGARMS